ncbi:hypothetical protein [Burkholderia cenocepacia]|nr:hypothetical protein [Burkholderia cenocepacia]
MERSTSIEAGRRRASAWIAIALTLLLAYGVARHVSRASPALQQ